MHFTNYVKIIYVLHFHKKNWVSGYIIISYFAYFTGNFRF